MQNGHQHYCHRNPIDLISGSHRCAWLSGNRTDSSTGSEQTKCSRLDDKYPHGTLTAVHLPSLTDQQWATSKPLDKEQNCSMRANASHAISSSHRGARRWSNLDSIKRARERRSTRSQVANRAHGDQRNCTPAPLPAKRDCCDLT